MLGIRRKRSETGPTHDPAILHPATDHPELEALGEAAEPVHILMHRVDWLESRVAALEGR